MSTAPPQTDTLLQKLDRLKKNIEAVFVGKPRVVNELLVGFLSRGHVLIEDVPGVGKTVLARALAKSIHCDFSRLQLTPDLLPSDILGVSIFNAKTNAFEFNQGPIFANVVLADEINRTTPRTQSALLEAMNESQVSMDGKTIPIAQPFMVVATQNPFEFEGTYALPESQLDRFTLRMRIGYPSREHERRIMREQPDRQHLEELAPVMSVEEIIRLQERVARVRIDEAILDYVLDLVEATRQHEAIEVGVSPRGSVSIICAAQALALLSGRDYVVPDDVKTLVVPAFAHRLVFHSFAQNGQFKNSEQILKQILEQTAIPE